MKVAFLFLVGQQKGGVYQYGISYLDSLVKNKSFKKITVYTNLNSLEKEGVLIKKINNYKVLFFLGLVMGILKLKPNLLFKNFDFVFSPTYSPLLFLTNTKFIFTLHDLQEKYFPEYFKKHIVLWRKFMYNGLTKNCHKIITESSHVKEDIIKYFKIDSNKISVIESPPIFPNIDKNFSLINNYKDLNFPYIFFPAQFWKHKNHIRVLKAFKILLDNNYKVNLVLTGSKQREYLKIVKFINDSKITESVRIISNIPQNHMAHFFMNSKLVIAPTLYESISIPVFEAFYYGVPVCASGVYAIIDQVGEAGELFDPYSETSIYLALKKILDSDEKTIKNYVTRGKNQLKYFSVERFNRLIDLTLNEN